MRQTIYKAIGDPKYNASQKEASIIRKFDQQIADSISKEGRKNIKRLSASDIAKVIEDYKERSNISSYNIIIDYPSMIKINK